MERGKETRLGEMRVLEKEERKEEREDLRICTVINSAICYNKQRWHQVMEKHTVGEKANGLDAQHANSEKNNLD